MAGNESGVDPSAGTGTAGGLWIGILGGIFEHFLACPEELPPEFRELAHRDGLERAVCDYVAGMTDGYAMEVYGELFLPAAWRVK